jgi:hypothetical protein
MANIRSLRRHGSRPAGFVRKAETLLTSGWSKATWRSRESILRTVDWLLRMELAQRRADGADPGPGHGGPRCDLRR